MKCCSKHVNEYLPSLYASVIITSECRPAAENVGIRHCIHWQNSHRLTRQFVSMDVVASG